MAMSQLSSSISTIAVSQSRQRANDRANRVPFDSSAGTPPRVALYLRVSTDEQTVENQRREISAYVQARGWTIAREYADEGVSGAKDRRPALDQLVKDAKRRTFDALVCWRLDRLGRNLRHLILLVDEMQALGVAFVSLAEGIDATTPAGRLQLHVLGAIAEFERARIAERVRAGLVRARAQGKVTKYEEQATADRRSLAEAC